MSLPKVLELVRSLDGILVLAPGPGSDAPEIAWGDYFFYYAPDGQVPATQPFATIVTKDYPDDTSSELDADGRWRLNIHVGQRRLAELTRSAGADPGTAPDPATEDVLLPHPVYGSLGWVAVVVPGPRTLPHRGRAAARRPRGRRGPDGPPGHHRPGLSPPDRSRPVPVRSPG